MRVFFTRRTDAAGGNAVIGFYAADGGKHMDYDCSMVGKIVRKKLDDVSVILSSDELGAKEKEELMRIFKDIAYQWCTSAATFFALEAAAERALSKEKYLSLMREAYGSGDRDEALHEMYPG